MEELQDLLVVHAGDLLALLRQDLLDIRAVVVEVPQVVGDQVEIVAAGTPNQHDSVVVCLLADLPRCARVAHAARKHDDHHVVRRLRSRDARQHLLKHEYSHQYPHSHAHP